MLQSEYNIQKPQNKITPPKLLFTSFFYNFKSYIVINTKIRFWLLGRPTLRVDYQLVITLTPNP
jgi:hypothetical protein